MSVVPGPASQMQCRTEKLTLEGRRKKEKIKEKIKGK
jgi:hypothetical protein